MTEAGKIWGNLFHRTVTSRGFCQSGVDKRLYILITSKGFVILTVVVDDMAMASDSRELLENVKNRLTKSLKVKLLGPLTSFIGWNLVRTTEGIYVS